jgi:hypothetical protein
MARYTKTGTPNTIGEVNAQFDLIALAINDTLSRVGDSPNQLETTLDANSKPIINLPVPSTFSEPLRLGDIGSVGQVVVDASIVENLTVPHIFGTVAEFKSSAIFFPVGKRIYLADRDAYFNVIAGTGTANNANIISSTTVSQSVLLEIGDILSVKALGAVLNGIVDDTIVIQITCDLAASEGVAVVVIPATIGGCKFEGVVVPDAVHLRGQAKGLIQTIDSAQKFIPVTNSATAFMVELGYGSAFGGGIFYDPNQKYTLANQAENFNTNPLCIKIGSATRLNPKGVYLHDICIVGFNKFVEQFESSAPNVENFLAERITGMPLEQGFFLRRVFDVPRFSKIHFNLNSYRTINNTSLITGDSTEYFYKVATQHKSFIFGRCDSAHFESVFTFGTLLLCEWIKDAFTGDSNNSGGGTFVSCSADVCHNAFRINRSNMNFGIKIIGGFYTPVVKVAGSNSAFIKYQSDCEFTKTSGSALRVFGETVPLLGDGTRSGLPEYIISYESTSTTGVNVASFASCQFEATGTAFANNLDASIKNYYTLSGEHLDVNTLHSREFSGGTKRIDKEIELYAPLGSEGLVLESATGTKQRLSLVDDGLLYLQTGRIPRKVAVPSTVTSTGVTGEIAFDGSFVYFCIASNSWVRAAVAVW